MTFESDPYRIIVTGARDCTDGQAAYVQATLQRVVVRRRRSSPKHPTVIVHGRCPKGGVDLVAHRWAESSPGSLPEPHPADWDQYGRAAGPIRNAEMVAAGADLCIGFPARGSRGTWDCIRRAADAGIPVEIWPLPPS